MYEFSIPDMSCGHCVSTVRKTIAAVDAQAVAEIDLDGHMATIESQQDAAVFAAALNDAGYPATLRTT